MGRATGGVKKERRRFPGPNVTNVLHEREMRDDGSCAGSRWWC